MSAVAEIVSTGRPEIMQDEVITNYNHGYRIKYVIFQDEDNVFNAVSLNIPGIATYANSEEEVIKRFQEAAAGAMEYYTKEKGEVPIGKKEKFDYPSNAKIRYITIYG